MLKFLDKWGGPETYPHMAAGWAVALDTPYQWTKQVASDLGGTKVGMAIHWPKGIKAKGELRTQFHHVIDVAPTILEAAGLPEPKVVNGVPQRPMDGVSMVYSFDDAKAKDRHITQYFEMFGNRAIYHDGWFARTIHRAPWEIEAPPAARRRHLGAVRHAQRLQPGQRPVGEAPAEAGRDAGPVHEGGGEEPRAADRRPRVRARQRGAGRSSRPDGAAAPR